jgi:hypothetical protein
VTFVLGLLKGAWGYIAAAGAALLAVLVVLFQAKKAGQNEVKSAVAEKEVKDAKTALEVEKGVATTKPDDVRSKLLDRYSRD